MSHARSRGQATRHWQMLDHNYDLLLANRRPGDGEGSLGRAEAAEDWSKQDDAPRPSMSAAMIRAGYEARKNPQAVRTMPMGRGFYRVLVSLLMLMVLVTLLGASVKEPPLAVFAAIIIGVSGVLWWRTRRGRHLMVLPTSARLRTPPKPDRG
jgi:hypothetical protein